LNKVDNRQSRIRNRQFRDGYLAGTRTFAVDAHRDVNALLFCWYFSANISRRQSDKRTRAVSNDTLSTMKAFFSIIVAVAVSIGSVQAGPVHT
jgi:hypothetical protein